MNRIVGLALALLLGTASLASAGHSARPALIKTAYAVKQIKAAMAAKYGKQAFSVTLANKLTGTNKAFTAMTHPASPMAMPIKETGTVDMEKNIPKGLSGQNRVMFGGPLKQ